MSFSEQEEEIMYMETKENDDNSTNSFISEYTGSEFIEEEDSDEDEYDETDEILDEIYEYESIFEEDVEMREMFIAQNPKKLYILSSKYSPSDNSNILIYTISINTFLKYTTHLLSRFIFRFSGIYLHRNPPIEIGMLYMNYCEHPLYPVTCCIIKTCWIRIVQRIWKKIVKIRKEIIEERKTIAALKYREIHGYWPAYITWPTIRGAFYLSYSDLCK